MRTLPLAKRKSTPKPGEVIVSVSTHARLKQISIDARFLRPWKPVVGGEAVVIEEPARGTIGVVGGLTPEICTIRIEDSTGASIKYFKPEKIAYLEPLRNTST